MDGKLWLDDCFLRYGSSNFISILDTDGVVMTSGNDIDSDMNVFHSAITTLLSDLSNKAYIPQNKGFAAGSANYSASGKLYGLVQCWRDISIHNCRKCLATARPRLEYSTKQGAQVRYGSCMARYEIYSFFSSAQSPSHSPEGNTPTISSPPLLPTSKKKSSKTLPIVLGCVGGSTLALLICLIVWRKAVKSDIFGKAITTATPNQERRELSPVSELLMQEHQFIFSLQALIEATENFHDNKKLGEGGFGAVYKGITRDGNLIAVKKLSARSTQGKREFMNEVKLVANVQHRNLAKLLGCCMEENERLLVYEYFPNKSLDKFLFDPEKCRELDWQKRYNIIFGIARGLLYLHEDSHVRIIHRDIKASNILLDHKLNPKIADFGLARFFSEDETHIHTRVAGTYGYMAPEYVMRGKLSVKVDVYSFGVLVLEIVTGRKSTDINFPYQMDSLLEWAWKQFNGGNGLSLLHSKVSEFNQEQALRCIHVGLLCVQADATLRPAMSNVIMMLSRRNAKLSNPSKPAFVSSSKSHASTSKSSWEVEENEKRITYQTSGATTSSSSGIRSVNEASITEIEAR
ncbi:hypothetical protein SUGI_0357420 [Cryptomeria japonica]|nr:hypothetical protein SUGI_0357420 [Cryptomeria japonica]